MNQSRRVAITMHPVRTEALDGAAEFIAGMNLHGIECVVEESRVAEMRRRLPDVRIAALSNDSQVELMVVFGGDGTILRSAEWALPHRVPLLGVNLGHVGFLAELEASQIDELIAQVADRDYEIEKRLTLAVTVRDGDGRTVWESFAVNEVSTEKASREKMVDLLVTIDERPLSRWGCDGVLVASASGSTAYAFSCGAGDVAQYRSIRSRSDSRPRPVLGGLRRGTHVDGRPADGGGHVAGGGGVVRWTPQRRCARRVWDRGTSQSG